MTTTFGRKTVNSGVAIKLIIIICRAPPVCVNSVRVRFGCLLCTWVCVYVCVSVTACECIIFRTIIIARARIHSNITNWQLCFTYLFFRGGTLRSAVTNAHTYAPVGLCVCNDCAHETAQADRLFAFPISARETVRFILFAVVAAADAVAAMYSVRALCVCDLDFWLSRARVILCHN